jgi:hypothetical protein
MPMSFERFPFYYRTQQQYEAVRRWAITLRSRSNCGAIFDLRAEVISKTHDASKHFTKVPESVPGDKKYIGVLKVPTKLLHYMNLTDTVSDILKGFGVELIDRTTPGENKIKEPVAVTFNVRSQKALSKVASQLDKKLGTGTWRFRGTRNFRKKLALIEDGTNGLRMRRRNGIGIRLPQVISGGNVPVTPPVDPYVEKLRRDGVDVVVVVDASSGLAQKDIEKMVFKAVLSS